MRKITLLFLVLFILSVSIILAGCKEKSGEAFGAFGKLSYKAHKTNSEPSSQSYEGTTDKADREPSTVSQKNSEQKTGSPNDMTETRTDDQQKKEEGSVEENTYEMNTGSSDEKLTYETMNASSNTETITYENEELTTDDKITTGTIDTDTGACAKGDFIECKNGILYLVHQTGELITGTDDCVQDREVKEKCPSGECETETSCA